ncbi:hypothetical protein CcaCcLH18_09563 [Colletotrichum camelliae]|nr:hypothetical protein CcaCcLH18_09563 [Colletotrichum camelliae]
MDSFPPKNGPSTAPYIQHQFHSEPPKKRSLGIHLDRFLRLRSDPDRTQLEPKPLNVRFWFTVGASLLAGYLVREYSAYWMYRVMRIHPNDVTYSDLSLVAIAIAGATLFTFLALSSIRNPGVKAAKTHHVC